MCIREFEKTWFLRFRRLGRLESKYEDTVSEYYIAFMSMCKKVAGLPLSEEEGRTGDNDDIQIRLRFFTGGGCKILYVLM